MLEQSELLGAPTVDYAGRPWCFLVPNRGFDSPDGSHFQLREEES